MKVLQENIPQTSFRHKIILISLVAMMIMLAATTVVWYYNTAQEARKSAERYIGNVLQQSNDTFETMVKDIDHLVTYASIDQEHVIDVIQNRIQQTPVEKLAGNQTIMETMLNLYQYKTYMEGLMITTPEGSYYRVGAILPYKQLISQPWYSKVDMDGNSSVILLPHSNGSDMVISVARNIFYGKEILGVVKADMKCNILEDCFDVNFEGMGQVYLVDTRSEVVFYPLSVGEENPIVADLLGNKERLYGEGSFYATVDGVDSLLIYSTSQYTGWTTVGVIPRQYVMQEFRNVSIMAVLMSFLLGVSLICLLYFLLSGQVNKVTMLCQAVEEIDTQIMIMERVVDSDDEIGMLQERIISMVERIKKLLEDIKMQQEEKRRLEMKMLRDQINPHFLHNTLNTIKFLAVLQNAPNIAEVTDSLSVLLQNNMKKDEYITLVQEKENLSSYLKIQSHKYSGKFTYSIVLDKEVEDCCILKMLLQPFLENALLHGIGPLEGMGSITVKLFSEDGKLVAVIHDNGVGMDSVKCRLLMDEKNPDGRIGISNVIRRIRLNYGEKYGVSMESSSMGTIVRMELPLVWHITANGNEKRGE